MNINLCEVYLHLYRVRLGRAESVTEYRNTLNSIIKDVVRLHLEKVLDARDVIYILERLPDTFTKEGEFYNFGLESLTESVVKGSTKIAFDGGDALAQLAAEKLRGDKK